MDTVVKREVAIKVVVGMKNEEKRAKCFASIKREIDLARKIDHANVLFFTDVFEENDRSGTPTFYAVMSFCNGGDLAHLIDDLEDKRRTISVAGKHDVILGIAKGLAAVHRADVLHRDIKPSNVLLKKDGDTLQAVLCDFGVSRELAATLAETNVGTPAFQAPEVSWGKDEDPSVPGSGGYTLKADIYSLGATFLALLTHDPTLVRSLNKPDRNTKPGSVARGIECVSLTTTPTAFSHIVGMSC